MKYLPVPFIILLLFSTACNPSDNSGQDSASLLRLNAPVSADYLLSATLWQQKSAEYRAICYQTYQLAGQTLVRKLAEDSFSLPPAVILDIDETVLDNSPFQARCILDNRAFTQERWKKWTDQAAAAPVPGALEFCQLAHEKGVIIIYLSNRTNDERESTFTNLTRLGFPGVSHETLILRDSVSSKEHRRAAVKEHYTLVMLIGDNLGDLSEMFEDRAGDLGFNTVDQYRKDFGNTWFILPNPMYGSWERWMLQKQDGESEQNRLARLKKALIAY